MAKRRIFDFSTAYAQLILLVFLPISLLAIVGTILVLRQTTHAARIEQQAKADIAITRYETVAYSIKNSLLQIQTSQTPNELALDKKDGKVARVDNKPNKKMLTPQEIAEVQQSLKGILQNVPQNRHILGMALVDEKGKTVVSTGNMMATTFESNLIKGQWLSDIFTSMLASFGYSSHPIDEQVTSQEENFGRVIEAISTNNPNAPKVSSDIQNNNPFKPSVISRDGMIYGKMLDLDNNYHEQIAELPQLDTANNPLPTPNKLWLLVNIDDEHIKLARIQVMFALAITGLFTILMLLLSLTTYARRWIAPIYEMRLHLQRTNANNLYKPMSFESSGEINQLQQDMTKTLRRLHTSFQELKNHAEQTEDDLRLAFDEMEMQNISIRNARDAAVSSSQTKSAFLANISHELRTPLNSIDGFINLLARHDDLNAEQNLYVQTIRKSSAHLLALVNDVLDFSKIEAGKLVLDKHEFDLYASIYDVVDMLSPLAAEKQLNLAVFFYDDVPRYLVGDALRVKQVLTNLVNNAIKFTDTGEIVVRVSLDDEQDDKLKITVQDTGKGVPKAQQPLLFQSFSQGDPSITRQYGGTGLGLVISKQLTQLMGGKIGYAYNDLDNLKDTTKANPNQKTSKGSIFWFTLPITLSNHQQQQRLIDAPVWELPAMFQTGSIESQMGDGKLHILVWMEHTASLQVLKGCLNQLAVAITSVQSANELLASLKEKGNRWDWVIMDNQGQAEITTLLKQIRLYYAGKLALYGYQLNLDYDILARYQAQALYQPLDRRQLYQLLGDEKRITNSKPIPQWQGYRVLAVDDHPPNLLVLEALLAELGIEVVTANSGYEAIDYICQQQADNAKSPLAHGIDLIFMDIQMPRMSGQEAAKRIRKLEPEHQHIPIIALTAHSLSDEKESLLASGIDDYVGKPISQAQLLQILQTWLGRQHETIEQKSITPSAPDTTEQDEITTAWQRNRSVSETLTHPGSQAMIPDMITIQKHIEASEDSDITHTDLDDLQVIDWDDALMRAAGKTELATNLMMMLIDSIDQGKTDLAQAWQDHDRQALANIAHRILGASRYTGVPMLRQASQNFEDKCLLSVQNQSPAQFALLKPWYEQLLQALDTLKNMDLTPWSQLYYYRLKEQDMPWKII